MYLKATLSALFLFVFTLFVYFIKVRIVHPEIKILFPLSLLKNGPGILDPSNTESVFEYYLLENISCGLVRDSNLSATGYTGCLSDRYYQPDNNTWVFHLRDMHWSDGQVVTSEEIENWIRRLTTSDSRHIEFLRLVDNFEFDEKTRILKLHFSVAIDDSVLHEMSLADAGLFPTNFAQNGWKRTIGPYSVEQWSDSSHPLILIANKFSPLYSAEMPQRAQLFWVAEPENRLKLFTEIQADIVPQTATANPIPLAKIRSNSVEEYVAHPTSILFFYFNKKDLRTINPLVRKEFSWIISAIRAKYGDRLRKAYGWSVEDQMVPDGFSGRLTREPEKVISASDVSHLPKHLQIGLFSNFEQLPEFTKILKEGFADFGIEIKIAFSKDPSSVDENFVGLYVFVGNQLDSSGSWSFLFSQHGVLKPWLQLVKKSIDAVFDVTGVKSRRDNLLQLHSDVLDYDIAVPIAVGSMRYFLSDRVDCSGWNRFDSRLRIYLLRTRGVW